MLQSPVAGAPTLTWSQVVSGQQEIVEEDCTVEGIGDQGGAIKIDDLASSLGSTTSALMRRQRSDLSDKIISSTPDAESYFKRKSAALSEVDVSIDVTGDDVTSRSETSETLVVVPMGEGDTTDDDRTLVESHVDISELSMERSELEVKPVLEIFPMETGATEVQFTSEHRQHILSPSSTMHDLAHSSSFEALYDTAQLETVPSNVTLEDIGVIGDPFRGTFVPKEAIRSSFENLYSADSPVISSPPEHAYQAVTEFGATTRESAERAARESVEGAAKCLSSSCSSEQYEDPHWYRIKSPSTDVSGSPGPSTTTVTRVIKRTIVTGG